MKLHENCPTCNCEFAIETNRECWAYCHCRRWKLRVKEVLNSTKVSVPQSITCPDCFAKRLYGIKMTPFDLATLEKLRNKPFVLVTKNEYLRLFSRHIKNHPSYEQHVLGIKIECQESTK